MNTSESFAIMMLCIATIDGDVAAEEIDRISDLYNISKTKMSIIVDEISKDSINLFEAIETASKSEEKIKFLNDIITLCYKDGKYQKEEKLAVRNLCNLLDIPENELSATEKSVALNNTKQIIDGVFSRFENKDEFKKNIKQFGEGTKRIAKTVGERITNSTKTASASVANGLGALNTRISFALASAKKTKQENEVLRAELKNNTLSETVKQNVIKKLNTKINTLKTQLDEEKKRNDENEEIIALLQMQIDDLKQTREIAENTKIA